LNGGPEFTFGEAISFLVDCESQDEVDAYWSKLSEGGEEGPCGWFKDKFGLSWQIIPTALPRLLGRSRSPSSSGPQPRRSPRTSGLAARRSSRGRRVASRARGGASRSAAARGAGRGGLRPSVPSRRAAGGRA